LVPDRLAGCRVAGRIIVGVDEILIQEAACFRFGERHGSHSVASASHRAGQIAQHAETEYGSVVAAGIGRRCLL
jgi:hypothetical protein